MNWLGLHLRKYVLSFANLSIPHAEQVPHYYKYVLSTTKFIFEPVRIHVNAT